tara:strand:- start:590 stop:1729 length:1140 start_codon:yes stop_codon:yes gene_type:complete
MISIEIKELSIRQSVCSFLIRENILVNKVYNFRIESCDFRQDDGTNVNTTLGVGNHDFVFGDVAMTYNIVRIGEPITGRIGDRDGSVYEEHYITTDNKEKVSKLIKIALEERSPDVEKRFSTFIWNARNELWRRDSSVPERSIDSVILDPSIMKKLKKDLDDFIDPVTVNWYSKHCIPFKRGYLFYGNPGTGKTSTISAIASYLKRKVYKLNLVAPGLCDNSLLDAVNSIKRNSILVMEDIDALFGVHREKSESFSTTFSGLLNAIDGLGDSKGHIFIMTSNHPEKIDTALRRKGRVDLEIEFKACTREQAKNMFLKFYPGEFSDAETFSKNISDNDYTPAQLQHHFIYHRKNPSNIATKIDESILKCNDSSNISNIYC